MWNLLQSSLGYKVEDLILCRLRFFGIMLKKYVSRKCRAICTISKDTLPFHCHAISPYIPSAVNAGAGLEY